MKDFDIILCTYNEADCIELTIKELNEKLHYPNIIIIDDNSPDGTSEIVESLKLDNIKLIKRKERGLATAFLKGLEVSSSKYIGWIDSNMPSIVTHYPKMLKNLEKYDFVLLSRYVKNGGDSRALIRSWSSFFFNLIARVILGKEIKDYTSGLFVSKRRIFQNINMKDYNHGEFTIELLFRIKNENIKILELPFNQPYEYQNNSKSFPNLFKFLSLGLFYLKTIFKLKVYQILNDKK